MSIRLAAARDRSRCVVSAWSRLCVQRRLCETLTAASQADHSGPTSLQHGRSKDDTRTQWRRYAGNNSTAKRTAKQPTHTRRRTDERTSGRTGQTRNGGDTQRGTVATELIDHSTVLCSVQSYWLPHESLVWIPATIVTSSGGLTTYRTCQGEELTLQDEKVNPATLERVSEQSLVRQHRTHEARRGETAE